MSEMAHPYDALKQLHIYLSEGCSLTCRQCWVQTRSVNGNGNGHHLLPVVFFMQAVREALPLGLQSVQLFGTDTLTHPSLDALLDWMARFELEVGIETNGIGLTQQLAKRLACQPLCSVSIGLDGADPATHDTLHQQPGSFERAAAAVRMLADANLPARIIFSVNRRNASQVPAVIRLAESLGASGVRFSLLQPVPALSTQPSMADVEDPLQVAEMIAIGWRVERELACSTSLQLFYDYPPAFRGLHPQGRIEGQGRCGLLNTLGVLSDGSYALCGAGQKSPELLLGKVGADPLEQVWRNHPILQRLRAGMPERLAGICDRCIMKTACMGNCAAENYFRTGSFWGPYWFCDAADKAGLFPAGRLIEHNW
jgi:SynChlorMet cassette radical SAM/SPASM protein ScmF